MVENLKCTDILVLQEQRYKLPTSRKGKNSICPFTLSQQKCYIFKIIKRIFKNFSLLKDEDGGYSDWKFEVHIHFSFAIATLQLLQHPEDVKISIFPITLSQKKCHIFKSNNEFSKPFLWLKDEERGSCGWKLEVHRRFSFAIATLQLFPHPENVKISIFPFTLSPQKCHIFKSIQRIFKAFFVAERWVTWLLWLKIWSAQKF